MRTNTGLGRRMGGVVSGWDGMPKMSSWAKVLHALRPRERERAIAYEYREGTKLGR